MTVARYSLRRSITRRYAILAGDQPMLCVNDKIAYPGWSAATAAATEMAVLDSARMRAYRCHLIPALAHFHLTTQSSGGPPPFPHRRMVLARILLAAPDGRVARAELRNSVPPVTRTRNEEVRQVILKWEKCGLVARDGQWVQLTDRQGLLEWMDEILAPHCPYT